MSCHRAFTENDFTNKWSYGYIYTSGQHIMLFTQWRVRPPTPLFCSAIYWKVWGKQLGFKRSLLLLTAFNTSFFFQKIQHHNSTGAASTVQGRLLCRVRWIQSSSWPDWGYHRDVCSVGLKDQHSVPGNTRVQGAGLDQEPLTAPFLMKHQTVNRWDTWHPNTSSFCNLFSLWRTKYYKSIGSIRK